jgi:hypothetical protein
VAGIVAAVLAPRDAGSTGLVAAVVGIPVGLTATLAFLGNADAVGAVLPLVGPLLVGLVIAYAITRFLRRGSPAATSARSSPDGPA